MSALPEDTVMVVEVTVQYRDKERLAHRIVFSPLAERHIDGGPEGMMRQALDRAKGALAFHMGERE